MNTGLNLLVFVGAFAAQWGVGAIIDSWPADARGGYGHEGFRVAFLSLLGVQVAALVWALIWRTRGDPESPEG